MTTLTVLVWMIGIGVWVSLTWLVGLEDVKCATLIAVGSYFIAWGACSSLIGARQKNVQDSFVILSVTFLLFLAAFELPSAIRLIDYQEIFPSPRGTWTVPDRELIDLGKPYYSVRVGSHTGDLGAHLCLPSERVFPSYEVKADRHGFRNAADYDQADIVVIGDSFIENGAVPDEALVTSELARLQNRVVANLGHSGYGPIEELIVLRRFALPLKPRIIIWAFFEGNDLSDIPRYYSNLAAMQSGKTLWERSFTRNAFITAVSFIRRCNPSQQDKIHSALFEPSNGRFQRFLVNYPSDRLTKRDSTNFLKAVATLTQAFGLASEINARFVVVFVPTKFRVYGSLLTFSPGSEPLNWELNDLPTQLKEAIAGISPEIQYIDLTPSLYNAAQAGNVVFFPNDTHLNNEGNRIAAEAIHRALVGQASPIVSSTNADNVRSRMTFLH